MAWHTLTELVPTAYWFRRHRQKPNIVLLEIATEHGEVPLCMTVSSLEQFARSALRMVEKVRERELAA